MSNAIDTATAPVLEDDIVLRRVCTGYGLFGLVVSAPFICVGVIGMAGPVMGVLEGRNVFGLLLMFLVLAFVLWTFLIPGIVSVLLLSASRLSAEAKPDARARFLKAYRLMRIGCVFSFMPFFVVLGSWGSLLFIPATIIRGDFGPEERLIFGVGAPLGIVRNRILRRVFPAAANSRQPVRWAG